MAWCCHAAMLNSYVNFRFHQCVQVKTTQQALFFAILLVSLNFTSSSEISLKERYNKENYTHCFGSKKYLSLTQS